MLNFLHKSLTGVKFEKIARLYFFLCEPLMAVNFRNEWLWVLAKEILMIVWVILMLDGFLRWLKMRNKLLRDGIGLVSQGVL